MPINISHKDMAKYKKGLEPRKIRARKKRTTLLSDKLKNLAFKQFDEQSQGDKKDDSLQVDEHLKMNDNYMRSGPYIPKKK